MYGQDYKGEVIGGSSVLAMDNKQPLLIDESGLLSMDSRISLIVEELTESDFNLS
jgi:hypothetical protein